MDTSLTVVWDVDAAGHPILAWQVAPPFWEASGSQASSLSDLCREAAMAFEREDWTACIAAHDRGLKAYEQLNSPSPADAFYRWFMLAGKASAQLRLADAGKLSWESVRDTSWEGMAERSRNLSRPLGLVLEWAKTAVLASARVKRWNEATATLRFLTEVRRYLSNQRPGSEEERRSLMQSIRQVSETFVLKMRDAYSLRSEASCAEALDWVSDLKSQVEGDGEVEPYLRDLLHHALVSNGDTAAAVKLARDMVAWTNDNASELRSMWMQRAEGPASQRR